MTEFTTKEGRKKLTRKMQRALKRIDNRILRKGAKHDLYPRSGAGLQFDK